MIRKRVDCAVVVALLVVCVTGGITDSLAASESGLLDIPYRRGEIRIDGELNDWQGPFLDIQFKETQLPANQGNQVCGRITWDVEWLYVAFEVRDAEVFPAPPEIDDFRLTRWDSVELYLDVDASGDATMSAGDLQIILSCDGRGTAMVGDTVLKGLPRWRVPKRPLPNLAIESDGKLTPKGYRIEAKLHFAGLGIEKPTRGMRIGIDVGCSDWLEDHPELPEYTFDLDGILSALEHPGESIVSGVLSQAETDRIISRAYRPLAWSGSRDWGFPDQWRSVRLEGRPAVLESMIRRLGTIRLTTTLLLLVATAGAVIVWLQQRSKRRIRELLATLDRLEAEQFLVDPPPEPTTRASSALAEDTSSASAGSLVSITVATDDEGTRPAPEARITARAVKIIQTQLEQSINATELACELNTSLRSLQRYLSKEADCSPGELIFAVKMREARRLLLSGDYRVTEVSARVGFTTPSHFSARFKEFYGQTPSDMAKSA